MCRDGSTKTITDGEGMLLTSPPRLSRHIMSDSKASGFESRGTCMFWVGVFLALRMKDGQKKTFPPYPFAACFYAAGIKKSCFMSLISPRASKQMRTRSESIHQKHTLTIDPFP